MIVKCEDIHLEQLKEFLKKEAIYNTFILADIDCYGFDKPFQQIYMGVDSEEKCQFVYLKFHNNLILSGETKSLNVEWVDSILKQGITVVMGKDNLIQKIDERHSKNYRYTTKHMYVLGDKEKLMTTDGSIKKAIISDVDAIHRFLMSIEVFKNMYSSKEMIINRIKHKEGIHVYIEKDGEIIAHGNSAATSEFATMIGGVATAPTFRNKQLATKVVSFLSKEIIAGNRQPCLFSERKESESFMKNIGFVELGKWGTLEIK